MKSKLITIGIIALCYLGSCEVAPRRTALVIGFHNHTNDTIIVEWTIKDSIPQKSTLMPFTTGKDSESLYYKVLPVNSVEAFTQDEFNQFLVDLKVTEIINGDSIVHSGDDIRALENWDFVNYVDPDDHTEYLGYEKIWE